MCVENARQIIGETNTKKKEYNIIDIFIIDILVKRTDKRKVI